MRIYALIAFLFLFTSVLSQESQPELNGRKLYTSIHSLSGNHFIASESAQQKILQLSALFADYKIDRILKRNDQLYFPENGSGRILLLDSTGGFSRLDHTLYGGDRFGAFTFFHKDTLYSIGGYGFWRVNGAIRFFDPFTKDWTPIIINKNVPIASHINAYFLHDKKSAKIYVLHSTYLDEYLSKEIKHQNQQPLLLDVFDLNTQKWQNQSLLITPKIAHDFSDLSLISSTDQYLIVNSKLHSQTLALDIKHNQVLELAPSFITSFVQLKDQHPNSLISQNDSSILFTDLEQQQTFSLNIKPLITKNLYPLYTALPAEKSQFFYLWLSLLFNILLIALLIVLMRRQSKIKRDMFEENEQEELMIVGKNKSFMDLLTETEHQIVQTIVDDFKAERLTSIDKINKIMGIEKRPYKIKNNLRADTLKMINKKFMAYLGNEVELIIRERSAFDKRFFEYTINERYVNKISLKKEQVQD